MPRDILYFCTLQRARFETGKALLLDKNANPGKASPTIEGHFTQDILLVLWMLQTYQEVLIRTYHPRHNEFNRKTFFIESQHLSIVFRSIVGIEGPVGKVIVQCKAIWIGTAVEFTEEGIISLQSALLWHVAG